MGSPTFGSLLYFWITLFRLAPRVRVMQDDPTGRRIEGSDGIRVNPQEGSHEHHHAGEHDGGHHMEGAHRSHQERVKNWTFIALATLGFVLSVINFVVGWFHHQAQVELTTRYETIRLMRDLVRDFSTDPLFSDIRTSIEACEPLYVEWKNQKGKHGKFDHDQLNRYLDFFERLGYLYREKFLRPETIDYFFGAYIIEAHEHHEVQQYIKGFQRTGQEQAFRDFQSLAGRLMEIPARRELANLYSRACPS